MYSFIPNGCLFSVIFIMYFLFISSSIIIEGLKCRKRSFGVTSKFQPSFVYELSPNFPEVLTRKNPKKQLHLFPHQPLFYFL